MCISLGNSSGNLVEQSGNRVVEIDPSPAGNIGQASRSFLGQYLNFQTFRGYSRPYSSRCMAYPFSGAVGGQMAAAADLGPDSWRRPAFAGALPALRI